MVYVLVEAEKPALEGRSEAAPSELEGDKEAARTRLLEGASVEQVIEESGLSRPVVLGLLGAIRKEEKRMSKSEEGSAGATDKVSKDDEEGLVGDFKDENRLAASAVVLARNKSRLRQQDPGLYNSLFPSGQPESNTSRLADLEIARYIRSMRLEEEGARHNNGDSSNETALLRKELETVKEEMRKKDVEELKGEIAELRQDLRHSTGSNSDLAVVIKETSNLIGKALETPGVLRNYLLPGDGYVQDKKSAPLLAQPVEPGSRSVVSELSKRGLVTKIIERNS